jgi:LCP family protein required for cell wall assembly
MTEEKRVRPRRVGRTPSALRHGQVKARGLGATITRSFGSALAVVLVAALSISAIALWDITRGLNSGVALAGDLPAVGPIEGAVNLLLVGSDSREGTDPNIFDADPGSRLNDVNMVLHINASHTAATIISIPRDMVVHFPKCPSPDGKSYTGGWSGPINATLNEGGLPCIALTVEELTGLDIQYAAMIGFNGVIQMANAIGGVEVCVAQDIEDEYTQTYLKAGTHTLSGLAALQFLRTRHGVGDGSDLGRISNQQVFLSSLVRKLKSASTLTNPVALFGLAKAAASNMTLSSSLSGIDTMVSIAMAMKDIPLDQIVFVQFPGTTGGEGIYDGKVQPDMVTAKAMLAAITADDAVALTGQTGRGSVLNTPTPAPSVKAAGANGQVMDTVVRTVTTPTPTPTPTPSTTVVPLPQSVTGQNAGEYTCSVGRTLSQQ